jgi:hypothetical protein
MPTLNTAQLLEALEKLKTDTTTTGAKYEVDMDDDYSNGHEIRVKLAELMKANKTLLSLEFRWSYSHKREGRDLIVFTEDQQIKVKLINNDNFSHPGEYQVPGFSEVDGLYTDEQDEPILEKVVETYDRSALKKSASVASSSLFKPVNSSNSGASLDEEKSSLEHRM